MAAILKQLLFYDSQALQYLMGRTPDPVVARLLNMADTSLRGRLFGAIEHGRMENQIRPLIERESEPDTEKDEIVRKALVKFSEDLIKEGKLYREGDFIYSR